jgi:hypothetical protein
MPKAVMARVTVPLGVLSTPFHTLHDFPPEEQWHKNPKKAERAAFTWKRFSEWLDFAKEDLIEKGLDLSAAREAERLRKRLLLSVLRQRKLGEGGTVEVGEPIRKKFLHGPALVGRLGPQALLNASFIGGVVSFVGAAALVIAEANRKKAGLEGVNPVLLHSAPQFFFSGLLGMAPKVFYGPPRKGLKKFFNLTSPFWVGFR